MLRLRVIVPASLLILLLSVGATYLLSNVQRLGHAVTLNPGATHPVPPPRRVHHVHRVARSNPAPTGGVVPVVRAAEPQPWFAPSPRYPIAALRARREGRVLVQAWLDAAGHVTGTAVRQSSGDAELDRAALAAVRRWTFTMPADARRETLVPIRFHIDAAKR